MTQRHKRSSLLRPPKGRIFSVPRIYIGVYMYVLNAQDLEFGERAKKFALIFENSWSG